MLTPPPLLGGCSGPLSGPLSGLLDMWGVPSLRAYGSVSGRVVGAGRRRGRRAVVVGGTTVAAGGHRAAGHVLDEDAAAAELVDVLLELLGAVAVRLEGFADSVDDAFLDRLHVAGAVHPLE